MVLIQIPVAVINFLPIESLNTIALSEIVLPLAFIDTVIKILLNSFAVSQFIFIFAFISWDYLRVRILFFQGLELIVIFIWRWTVD